MEDKSKDSLTLGDPKCTEHMLYVHRCEYRTLDENGVWSEPEIRYHNRTVSRETAIKRHAECKDSKVEYGRLFEGSYGYRWENCTLIKRTTLTAIIEQLVEP